MGSVARVVVDLQAQLVNTSCVADSVGGVGPEAIEQRFAENLIQMREQLGFSQADLVRRLREAGWTGLHQTTISRIEKGERPVRLGEARAIAQLLGTTTERMLLPTQHTLRAMYLHRGRDRVMQALDRVTSASHEFYRDLRSLGLLAGEYLQEGFKPVDISTLTNTSLKPVSVEDELAMALYIVETADPAQAVARGGGRWQIELEQNSGLTETPASEIALQTLSKALHRVDPLTSPYWTPQPEDPGESTS